MQPHDRFFRHVFSDPEHAAGELRTVLPPDLASKIDWSTLRLVPSTFVDPELAELRSDLLFSVSVEGRRVLLYVLAEHQSSSEPCMPLRMLGYMVRIWEAERREHPTAAHLPAIIPVVVYHDERPWTAPTSFAEMFDVPAETLELLQPYMIDFELALDDLSIARDDELRARAMTALGRVALLCLKRARDSQDIAAELRSWIDLLREVVDAPNGVAAFGAMLRYILNVTDTPPEQLRELAQTLGPTVEEVFMTGEQVLVERGRAQGKAEGKAEGEAKGKAEAILRVLQARGLSIADAQRAHVLACTDVALLDRWLERSVTASSVDAVLAD